MPLSRFGILSVLVSSTWFLSACAFDPDTKEVRPVNYRDFPSSIPEESWHFSQIGYDYVLNKNLSGAGVRVAVIDTGFDLGNAHLTGQSVFAWDVTEDYADVHDENGHGTAMAAIVAGLSHPNGVKLGIAPDADLLLIKAMRDGTNYFTQSAIADAVDLAAENGAQVVNLSLGSTSGSTRNSDYQAMLAAASQGVIIVVSTGNDGTNNSPNFYATHAGKGYLGDTVIAVAALDQSGQIASYSSPCNIYNPTYCIVAPGSRILTVDADGDYENVSGTSPAAAIVSGSMAILLEYFPNLTPAQAVEILLTSATDAGASGVDRLYGSGILNLEAALQPIGVTNVIVDNQIYPTSETRASVNHLMSNILHSNAWSDIPLFDAYEREYRIDLRAFMQNAQRTASSDQFSASHRLSQDIQIDSLNGNLLFQYYNIASLAQNHLSIPQEMPMQDVLFSLNPNTRLAFISGDEDAHFALAAAASADLYHLEFAYQKSFEPFQAGIHIGHAQEFGTSLGNSFDGAFGAIRTSETFTIAPSIRWDYKNFGLAYLHQFSQTETKMDNRVSGLIADISRIHGEYSVFHSYIRGIAQKEDKLSLSWQAPFSLTSGSMRIENGEFSENIDLASQGNAEIYSLTYELPINEHHQISFSTALWQIDNEDPFYSSSINWSIKL